MTWFFVVLGNVLFGIGVAALITIMGMRRAHAGRNSSTRELKEKSDSYVWVMLVGIAGWIVITPETHVKGEFWLVVLGTFIGFLAFSVLNKKMIGRGG